jgi:tripartite-type tricarboxylate transporter receptor subunit TctC
MFRPLPAAAAAFAATVSVSSALAQDYPTRPIRLIVQTQPGGLVDQFGRTLAQKITENTGATVFVDNRVGGGLFAAEYVLRLPPDGYTIYIGSHATQAIHPHLTKNLRFDPVKDFAPVILLATTPTLLVVHPDLPASSLKELIARTRSNPGRLSYGSEGIGSSAHMAGEQFKQLTNSDIVHVPYKGAAPAMRDLLGGQLAMMFDTVAFSAEQVSAGKLKALAVVADRRVPLLPDVPTMAEAGLPAMQGSPWFGLVVSAKTPRPIIDWINREANRAFSAPDVQERFTNQGFLLPLGTPEAFGALIAADSHRWGNVIRRAGIAVR